MTDLEPPDSQNKRFSVQTMQEDSNLLPATPPQQHEPVTRLTESDHIYLLRSIAGVTETEHTASIHPTSSLFPPRGLPPSLYRTVIEARTSSSYRYMLSSLLFNVSLILQLLLGAALTALGSSTTSTSMSVPITVLAAANTVNAGVLALMHNSGLPDRFKKDKDEFEKVELNIREVLETGCVKGKGVPVEEVVEGLWDMFRDARGTVARNRPDNYVASALVGKKDEK